MNRTVASRELVMAEVIVEVGLLVEVGLQKYDQIVTFKYLAEFFVTPWELTWNSQLPNYEIYFVYECQSSYLEAITKA